MRNILTYLSICIIIMAMPSAMQAQDRPNVAPEGTILPPIQLTGQQITQISDDMNGYISEVSAVIDDISITPADQLDALQRELQSIDVRWTAYTQIEQVDIGSSAALMDILSQYKVVYMTANDSITHQKARLDALSSFNTAAAFIAQCKAKYPELSRRALALSLVPQTAKQLEDVKAQETMLFQQVEANYQKAVAAAALSDEAKAKMPAVQQDYISIKASSTEIQAYVYKPWVERIKDYVMTFAGFAVMLVVLNFFITKINAMKQARKMAKKYSSMLNGGDDIPTI